jgi:hypothetical protein
MKVSGDMFSPYGSMAISTRSFLSITHQKIASRAACGYVSLDFIEHLKTKYKANILLEDIQWSQHDDNEDNVTLQIFLKKLRTTYLL